MFRSLFFTTEDNKVFAIPIDGIKYTIEELKQKFLEACTEANIDITEEDIQFFSVKDIDSENTKKIPFISKISEKGIVLTNWTMESWLRIQKLQVCE